VIRKEIRNEILEMRDQKLENESERSEMRDKK
jgi:hypothetical protein